MQIARPPDGGFLVLQSKTVEALIDSYSAQWPRLSSHWLGICLRLKFTGHREGAPVAHRPGWRLFIDDGDPLAGLPKIRIVYRVVGDMISIEMAGVG
jgi:hypothetical protein